MEPATLSQSGSDAITLKYRPLLCFTSSPASNLILNKCTQIFVRVVLEYQGQRAKRDRDRNRESERHKKRRREKERKKDISREKDEERQTHIHTNRGRETDI